MFGKNPIRKQDLGSPERLWVQEMFSTIQGEGPFQGIPAFFIRLGGCNLKCYWCDTDFESSDTHLSVSEIVNTIGTHVIAGAKPSPGVGYLVVITGGEPFRQDITELLKEIAHMSVKVTVQIETNGTLWLENFGDFIEYGNVVLVCSPKTGKVHPNIIKYCWHWKYICDVLGSSPVDGLPMASTQVKNRSCQIYRPDWNDPWNVVWVQPLDTRPADPYGLWQNTKHTAEVSMKYGYRLCLQQHKIVGLP